VSELFTQGSVGGAAGNCCLYPARELLTPVLQWLCAGKNWTAANTGMPNCCVHARTLAIDPVTPTILYAGAHSNMYNSSNSGGDWSTCNTGIPSAEITSLVIVPDNAHNPLCWDNESQLILPRHALLAA
jgi:hypothetical protein